MYSYPCTTSSPRTFPTFTQPIAHVTVCQKIEFPSFAFEPFVLADELLLKIHVAAFNLPAPK